MEHKKTIFTGKEKNGSESATSTANTSTTTSTSTVARDLLVEATQTSSSPEISPITTTITPTETTAEETSASAGRRRNFNIDDIKHCFDNLIVIDAGANLTNKKYNRDLESVVQRAKDAGKYL